MSYDRLGDSWKVSRGSPGLGGSGKLNYSPISSGIRFATDFARFAAIKGKERILGGENESATRELSFSRIFLLAGRVVIIDRSRGDFWRRKRGRGEGKERKKEAISARTRKWRGIRLSVETRSARVNARLR